MTTPIQAAIAALKECLFYIGDTQRAGQMAHKALAALQAAPAPGSIDTPDERAAFEKAMNDSRFFPRELDFGRTKSPSGRDEYSNSHLQSNWIGWQARAHIAQRATSVPNAPARDFPPLPVPDHYDAFYGDFKAHSAHQMHAYVLADRAARQSDKGMLELVITQLKERLANADAHIERLEAVAPAGHADDAAVDRFAVALKAKMAAARAKGRSGWSDPAQCPVERLQAMLRDHIAKGDPVDVGNFAMMLFNRGERAAGHAEPVAVWEATPHGWDTLDEIEPDWLESLPMGTRLYYLPAAPVAAEPAPKSK